MAQYIIRSTGEPAAFSVECIGDNSVRQTILGFLTQDEASAWIEADQKRSSLTMAGSD
jgi:hypothetical protein